MDLVFRSERDILIAISRLGARVGALEAENASLKSRVKSLEDRGGSDDNTIHAKLDLLVQQQGLVLQQLGVIIMTNAEFEATLNKIDASTTAMAGDLTRATASITEIGLDIDALLTRAPGEPISDALKARFEQHAVTLENLKADLSAKATLLEATAAKSPVPATEPPPVEPPPVENPPVEEPPVETPVS